MRLLDQRLGCRLSTPGSDTSMLDVDAEAAFRARADADRGGDGGVVRHLGPALEATNFMAPRKQAE